MTALLSTLAVLGAITSGAAVPLLWVLGLVLIVLGVFSLIRGGLIVGILLIVVGVILGGLNIF